MKRGQLCLLTASSSITKVLKKLVIRHLRGERERGAQFLLCSAVPQVIIFENTAIVVVFEQTC